MTKTTRVILVKGKGELAIWDDPSEARARQRAGALAKLHSTDYVETDEGFVVHASEYYSDAPRKRKWGKQHPLELARQRKRKAKKNPKKPRRQGDPAPGPERDVMAKRSPTRKQALAALDDAERAMRERRYQDADDYLSVFNRWARSVRVVPEDEERRADRLVERLSKEWIPDDDTYLEGVEWSEGPSRLSPEQLASFLAPRSGLGAPPSSFSAPHGWVRTRLPVSGIEEGQRVVTFASAEGYLAGVGWPTEDVSGKTELDVRVLHPDGKSERMVFDAKALGGWTMAIVAAKKYLQSFSGGGPPAVNPKGRKKKLDAKAILRRAMRGT